MSSSVWALGNGERIKSDGVDCVVKRTLPPGS